MVNKDNQSNTQINFTLAIVVASGLFMENLDTTILTTAIPTTAHFFKVNPIAMKLAFTSYLIVLSIFIPISGWLAEKYGAKNIFLLATSLFTLSSLLCGLSQQLWQLILCRMVQGLGGALMTPVGRLILFKVFPQEHIINAINYYTIPALFGPMLGPLCGGLIITYLSWQWIFFINIPIGLISLFWGYKKIPCFPKHTVEPLDWVGFILFGTALSCFVFLLNSIEDRMISSTVQCLLFLIVVIAGALFFLRHRWIKKSFIHFDLFTIRTFRITAIGGFFSRLGFTSIPFILPLLLQCGLSYSPMQSGLLTCFVAFGAVIMKYCTKYILKHLGFKTSLRWNSIALGVTIIAFTMMNQTTPVMLLGSLIFLYGMLISLQFTCLNVLIFSDLAPNLLSHGTSISSCIQQLATGIGVAIGAILLKAFVSPSSGHVLDVSTFHNTFMIIGLYVGWTGIFFSYLKQEDGQHASGYVG